ncbi:hypothetical protein [Actinomadura sp. DC4]|uniref:hypothetical protein n=1 Tax=Actinomadura sp. DC4 TaxID=3055069 RepID=UPI0025B1D921|nr:hypothetical protein [Actinomadura sp. DC4]MDN3351284.1 hypothetical protein [Actinomadura sp. DC4]
MPFTTARTRDEAHLYLDLHPCDECGSVDTTWESALVPADGELANRYAGTCGGCGVRREFWFGLPERGVVPAEYPAFGGPEPSALLDAGQWRWVADLTAGNVPEDDPAEARRSLAIARAAVEEVLKFVPPGADAVPGEAFWSEQGRQVYDASPSRFALEELLAARTGYREQAKRYPAEKASKRE